MTIKPLLIGALEASLNQYLSLDQDSSFFLAPLAGKVIAVIFSRLMKPFTCALLPIPFS